MVARAGAAARRPTIEARKRSVLRGLGLLSKGHGILPTSLHAVRTNLRRLQAWFDLLGDHDAATRLDACILPLSPLRTLHVLEGWLVRRQSSQSDLRKVRRAARELANQVAKKQVFETIRQTVNSLGGLDRHPDHAYRREAWRLHLNSCGPLLSALRKNPKRKRLHALRLELKQLRYQLEWTMADTGRHERLIEQLKQAQRCLGNYEEQAAFRKLAKRLDLQSRPAIVKRWRRARETARALPQDMGWLLVALRQLVRGETSHSSGNRFPKRVNVDVTNH